MGTLQYHFSPKTRKFAECSAKPGNCPFKGAEHISATAYENLQSGESLNRSRNQQNGYQLRTGRNDYITSEAKIAPEGVSGIFCTNCGKYLSEEASEDVQATDDSKCNHCKKKIWLDVAGVDIRHSEKRYLTEAGVREASWFHATTNPDWLNDMSEKENRPFIHVGSRAAAMDRLRDIAKWQNDGSVWYLYEVKVESDRPVSTGVFDDENDSCPSSVQAAKRTEYQETGVNRYLNRFEAPGTISLVGDPTAFYEASCVTVPLDKL